MKKYSTILILGAGSSKPYGFPVGEELLAQIKSFLRPGNLFHTHLLREKYLATDIEKLLLSLHKTQVDTIDEFFGAPVCRNNAEYTKILKYAIAYALLSKENSDQLENPNDWYKKLYVRIFGFTE